MCARRPKKFSHIAASFSLSSALSPPLSLSRSIFLSNIILNNIKIISYKCRGKKKKNMGVALQQMCIMSSGQIHRHWGGLAGRGACTRRVLAEIHARQFGFLLFFFLRPWFYLLFFPRTKRFSVDIANPFSRRLRNDMWPVAFFCCRCCCCGRSAFPCVCVCGRIYLRIFACNLRCCSPRSDKKPQNVSVNSRETHRKQLNIAAAFKEPKWSNKSLVACLTILNIVVLLTLSTLWLLQQLRA